MMVKRFKPTKEQLEILAKVAGVKLKWVFHTPIIYVNIYWEPENNRDQIAMVIEGLTDKQTEKYIKKMKIYYTADYHHIYFGQIVSPAISCEKLLEVVG